MYIYILTCNEVENDWHLLLYSNPDKYFELEQKYINTTISVIEELGFEMLNVKNLCNYEFMEFERFENEIQPVSREIKDFYIRHRKNSFEKFSEKYLESTKDLYAFVKEGMGLNIYQIRDILKLKFRGNICYFILHSYSTFVIDFADMYVYIYCENAINEEFLKSINNNGINLKLCTMDEYNDIYPLIKEQIEM